MHGILIDPSKITAGLVLRRGKLTEPTLHGGQNGYQYLYDYMPDQLRQTSVEVLIRRARTAMVLEDWRGMCVAATKADEAAKMLEYEPLNARCRFYKGISLYNLREYWNALEDLTFARACINIYEEEEEVETWISRARIATTKSPSRRQFSHEPRTPDTTTTTPITPASSNAQVAQALADDLGSALRSGRWSSLSSRPGSSAGPSGSTNIHDPYREPSDGFKDINWLENPPSTTQPIQPHGQVPVPSIGPVPGERTRRSQPPGSEQTGPVAPNTSSKPSVRFEDPSGMGGRRATVAAQNAKYVQPPRPANPLRGHSLRERTMVRAASRLRSQTAAPEIEEVQGLEALEDEMQKSDEPPVDGTEEKDGDSE
ncbi:MAG: hypothetical protein Q9191_005003 [Dirinaria sp. TL-2023a]